MDHSVCTPQSQGYGDDTSSAPTSWRPGSVAPANPVVVWMTIGSRVMNVVTNCRSVYSPSVQLNTSCRHALLPAIASRRAEQIMIVIIFLYYSCSQIAKTTSTESTSCEAVHTIERKASTVYTAKHNTRFSTGTISCYIQSPGLPRCCNLINTNQNNESTRILNIE